jgi:hypothetical protein
VKKSLLIAAFLFLLFSEIHAQQVQGIVVDKDTKQRLTRVYLYNTRTHTGYYNNLKGEFSLPAAKGDTLVVAVQGYLADTATVKDLPTLLISLKRTSILLNEVKLTGEQLTPESVAKKNREEFSEIYRKGNAKDLLKIGGLNGRGGVGLSIDALYSLFSREGKNARYLQQILERDYKEAIIDYRFTKTLVTASTNLTDPELSDFMQQYRPSYYFITEANDYKLIAYIRSSYEKYVTNPKAYRTPKLEAQ